MEEVLEVYSFHQQSQSYEFWTPTMPEILTT